MIKPENVTENCTAEDLWVVTFLIQQEENIAIQTN